MKFGSGAGVDFTRLGDVSKRTYLKSEYIIEGCEKILLMVQLA